MAGNVCRLMWTIRMIGIMLLALDPSGRVTAIDADETILVTNASGIYKSTGVDSGIFEIPIADVGSPYGIDVDIDARAIFWTDTTSRKIKRVDLDGGDATIIAATGSSPRGIAVDAGSERIYWTDISTDSIETVKYDGSGRRRVLSLSNRDPMAIAVDGDSGYLYWTNTGSQRGYSSYSGSRYTYYRQVMRSGVDGLDQRTLVTLSSSYQPLGIALINNGTIIWCETSYQIRSVNSGGSNARTLARGTCRGVAFLEGRVYWTDHSRHAVAVGLIGNNLHHPRYLFIGELRNPIDIFVGLVPRLSADAWECTFDTSYCGWHQSEENDFNWGRASGQTAVAQGGPGEDHTQGNRTTSARFMFATTANSSHTSGSVATLVSPPTNASGSEAKCFRFWYFMGNAQSSTLRVFFQADGVEGRPKLLWSRFGVQPDEWIGTEFPLTASGTGRILVRFTVGGETSSSVAIDDVRVGHCREASRLTCEDDSMTVHLDRAKLGIFDADDVTLRSEICRGYAYDPETVGIRIPYDDCGTLPHQGNETIVFSNVITVAAHPGIRSSSINIRVNCSLQRSYRVEMSYMAHAWVKYISEEGIGNFTVGIRQYPTEKIQDAFPASSYPQQVDAGDTIYMATEMSVKDMVQSHNTRCWATATPDPKGDRQRDLITDGCPADGNVRLISSDKPNLQPFSFRAFSFDQPDMHLIYVHCDVIVCGQSDDSVSACNRNCTSSSRARRYVDLARDVRSGPHIVSQGPFVSRQDAPGSTGVQFNLNSVLLIVASVCLVTLAAAVGYSRIRREQDR